MSIAKINLPCKILLVDDDSICNFISETTIGLYDIRIECEVYDSPRLALDRVLNDENTTFSLIILDINMQELKGWQFLDQLQKENVSTPVVILSSSVDPRDQTKAKEYAQVLTMWQKQITFEMIGLYF